MQTTVTVTELKAPETAEVVKQKIRLAPYCRVSSPSEDQLHSFAAQIRHYTEYVGTHPEYELVDIYADEGLSGTSMQKRDELNRLLRDCAKGKVDRIITKSVSRLSRNAKEFLETVRLLKSLGISIYFEEQGIDTDKLNAEMILTFPGLHAQQESENISRNTRWSIQKRMARGEYFGTHAPLGYRFQDGRLTVEEPEAETVRRIFDLYLQGYGCQSIAELLNREGNISERTNGKILDRWYPGTVRYIIGNERYVGDALLQKRYNAEALPYRTHRNYGERKQYYAEQTHPPIIERALYDEVQKLLKTRYQAVGETRGKHQLNRKLICPECGSAFRKVEKDGKRSWVCSSKALGRTSCKVERIREETVYRIFRLLLLKLHDYGDALLGTLIDQLETLDRGIRSGDHSPHLCAVSPRRQPQRDCQTADRGRGSHPARETPLGAGDGSVYPFQRTLQGRCDPRQDLYRGLHQQEDSCERRRTPEILCPEQPPGNHRFRNLRTGAGGTGKALFQNGGEESRG